ncbi:MAG: YdcF family protein [Ignavibacteria bacterium]|nr:YdcF family protein [Ignavibacteria bacterium]
MFLLKKFIAMSLYPLSICVEIMIVGVILLWFTKKEKAGRLFVTLGLLLLMAVSYRWVPYKLLGSLESEYPALVVNHSRSASGVMGTEHAKWIVVLASGQNPNPNLPLTSQISAVSMVRLTEGIRLYREIPGSKLLLSGGNYFGPPADAEVMAKVAVSLGVNQQDIVLESKSEDTAEQAQFIYPIVKNDRFILVTSASHMPRAMALFRKQGMSPIPAPTDYMMKSPGLTPANFYPNVEALEQTKIAVYEYLGMAWAKVRGKI